MNTGMLGEFASPEALLEAVQTLRASGYRGLEAYSPYRLSQLEAELAPGRTVIPWAVFISAVVGGTFAYGVQWWTNAVDYPLNIGSFAPDSIPPFIPITFEFTVLFAGIGTFVSILALSGLPKWWHPLFEVEGFERATIDRFFLAVDSGDPSYVAEGVRHALQAAGALRVVAFGESP